MAISDAALLKIGELLAYAMAVNLFLLGVEVYTEFYSQTAHMIHARFQWFGIDGGVGIAIYTWTALALNTAAFIIFVVPNLRRRIPLLALGCVFSFSGVYIEKGMGLVLPGLTPDVLGEVYAYVPSMNELMVGLGIWAVGALLFTFMFRVANAITRGKLRNEAALTS
jgi:molybdopterin-containing oxidoreductase family membrane subunit